MWQLRLPKDLSSFRRVRVHLELTQTRFENYTAKLVKSYLICVDDHFAKLFSVEGGYKEFHITPLLDDEGKAIYPKKIVKCSFCKDRKPSGKGVVELPSKASFEIAGPEELVSRAFSFGRCDLSFGGETIEINSEGAEEVGIELGEGEQLWIKLRGPAVLRDPWHKPGEALRTRFLPSPSHLFSVNVYSLFPDKYFDTLVTLERALIEDHSTLHSAGKVWYYYDGKWLPALTGTLLFWIRETSEELKAILYHAALFGVGSGRAAGFGDLLLDIKL